MQNKLLGSMLLIAGTSIGAGMLALPISTFNLGFFASSIAIIWIWSAMLLSALFMLEAVLTQPKGTNLTSLAIAAFGNYGRWLITCLYLALLYSLNAAYIHGIYSIILENSANLLIGNIFSGLLLLIFVILLSYGFKSIDSINKFLVILLALVYAVMAIKLSTNIQPKLLSHHGAGYLANLPIIIVAFGFQIIIPSIRDYCDSDIKTITTSIILGSLIPLILYLSWQACTLGIIPIDGDFSFQSIHEATNPVIKLSNSLIHHTQWGILQSLIKCFVSLAIITSFIGVSISLFDFFKDAARNSKKTYKNIWLLAAAFIPSLLFILYCPKIFMHALEYGGIIVAILLGLAPVLIAKQLRKNHHGSWQVPYGNFCAFWVICAIVIVLYGSKGVI